MPHGMSQWAYATLGGEARSRALKKRSVSEGCINELTPCPSGWTLQYLPVYTQGVWRPRLDRLPGRRFVVQDTSRQPALQPRDRLLVGVWLHPRRGDVVVVRDPQHHSTFLIK